LLDGNPQTMFFLLVGGVYFLGSLST